MLPISNVASFQFSMPMGKGVDEVACRCKIVSTNYQEICSFPAQGLGG